MRKRFDAQMGASLDAISCAKECDIHLQVPRQLLGPGQRRFDDEPEHDLNKHHHRHDGDGNGTQVCLKIHRKFF